eukprot:4923493-Prymnesium_polylepis.2
MVFGWLGTLALLIAHFLTLLFVAATSVFDFDAYANLDFLFMMAGAGFSVASSLNISLMWIEFAIACQRLASVESNLYFTRRFLFHYLVGFLTLCAVSVLIEVIWERLGFLVFVAINIISCLFIIVSFSVGARKMTT